MTNSMKLLKSLLRGNFTPQRLYKKPRIGILAMGFKQIITTILLSSIVLALLVPACIASPDRIALVIGNGDYNSAPLRNPPNDAEDMAKLLAGLSFRVTKLVNAGHKLMEDAIYSFGRKLRSTKGVGLFYFAGHGMQVKGVNYLIPIDARVETEGDVKHQSISANHILSKMQDAGNPLNMVFLDACRNNPIARSFRSGQQGLAYMEAPSGSLVVFATAPGGIAKDGSARNGVFTKHLLRQIPKPGIEIGYMMRDVRAGVKSDTNDEQTPFEVSSLTGKFYFNGKSDQGEGLADERRSLENERRELERLKAELEEKKRQEKFQQKATTQPSTQVAAIDPAVSRPRIVDRDGSFEKYANGVVFDSKTGLEWHVGPDKKTTWLGAKSWVDRLSVGGGGWRMPTSSELDDIETEGIGLWRLPSLLRTSSWSIGWWIWHGGTASSSGARFFYSNIDGDHQKSSQDANHYRGFAVRSRR